MLQRYFTVTLNVLLKPLIGKKLNHFCRWSLKCNIKAATDRHIRTPPAANSAEFWRSASAASSADSQPLHFPAELGHRQSGSGSLRWAGCVPIPPADTLHSRC